MFLNFILIICVSGSIGHTNRKQFEDGNLPQQWDLLVTFVNMKIEGMETLLKQKEDRVDQLESDLASQETKTNKLTQGMASLERALLQKDDRFDQLESDLASQETKTNKLTQGMASLERALLQKDDVVDRLVKTISELQKIVIHDSISSEGDPQPVKYIIDSNSSQDEIKNRSPSSNNEQPYAAHLVRDTIRETELKKYATSFLKSENGNVTYSKPHAIETSAQHSNGSRTTEGNDEANEKVIMLARKQQFRQSRVAPPSPSPTTTVAFHVTISGSIVTYTKDAIVIYGHETLDQGSGYNPVDGIYVTPETGTYVFTWTTICEKHNYFQTVLVVNGSIRGSSWTESTDVDDYHQTTAVVILTLSQGDHVFIRMGHTYGQGTIINLSTIGSSTFSGWKLG